tara:strand:- start:101122 stop:101430 length:309 start_codon:yes stop_codon:yes gene_type:complete
MLSSAELLLIVILILPITSYRFRCYSGNGTIKNIIQNFAFVRIESAEDIILKADDNGNQLTVDSPPVVSEVKATAPAVGRVGFLYETILSDQASYGTADRHL